MSTSLTYYAILGVAANADASTIRLAYRALSQRHHPDKNLHDVPGAVSRMQSINEAYRVLSDPATREAYDATLRYQSSPPSKSTCEHESSRESPADPRPPQASAAHTGGAAATPRPAVRPSTGGRHDPAQARAGLPISTPRRMLWPYLLAVDGATLVLSPECASNEVFLWQLIAFCAIFFCYRSKRWLGRLVALALLVFTAVGVQTAGLTVVQFVTVIAAVRGARSWPKRDTGRAQSAFKAAKGAAASMVRFSVMASLCVTAILSLMSSSHIAQGSYATQLPRPAVPQDTFISAPAVSVKPPMLPSSSDATGRTDKQQSLTDALMQSAETPVVAPTGPVNAHQLSTSDPTYESMYMRESEKTRVRLAQEEAEFEARLEVARQRRLQDQQGLQ